MNYDLLQKESPFRVVAKTDLPAIEMGETPLSKRPRTDQCTIWTIALAKSSTLKQLAAQILDAEENTPEEILIRLLESRGHTMTEAQTFVTVITSTHDDNFFFFMRTADDKMGLRCFVRHAPMLCADTDLRARGVDRILVRNLNNSWPWV